ncbi:MAG: hypothetical protein IJ260_00145 [Butyrivibrio sp.]|nr:hypothetical protein [Butyrivibrio sp.]
MWSPTYASDELYHHGILGMHWGQRNGPPYPLADGAHSAEEKRAKYKKSMAKAKSSAIRLKKKAAKLNIKAAKLAKKGAKLQNKSARQKEDMINRVTKDSFFSKRRRGARKIVKAETLRKKAGKAELKAAKMEKRAELMNKKLSEIDKDTLQRGKEIFEGALNKKSFSERRAEAKKVKQREKNLKKARDVRQKNKEAAARKEEILRKGSARDVAKIKDQLTSDDYKRVFERLENEQKLNQRINADVKTTKDRVTDIVSMVSTLSTASQNAINLYNNGAKIYNTFNKSGKKMKIIGEKDTSTIDFLINKANVDTVVRNRDKLNGKDLQSTLARLKTEDSLNDYYKKKLEERIKR